MMISALSSGSMTEIEDRVLHPPSRDIEQCAET